MINQNAYQQYQQNAINSATPVQLTLMLYNGAIKFARQGLLATAEGRIEVAHHSNMRVQEIVYYLQSTLDLDQEISGNLSALYTYMTEQLIQANLKKDPAVLQEVVDMLEELRDTWGLASQGLR